MPVCRCRIQSQTVRASARRKAGTARAVHGKTNCSGWASDDISLRVNQPNCALVWMRRKAKRRQPVDDLVDALIKMRRKAKKKVAKRKKTTKKRAKSKS